MIVSSNRQQRGPNVVTVLPDPTEQILSNKLSIDLGESVMAWSRDLAYSSRRINLIFHSFTKILHASISAPTSLTTAMIASHRRHPHLPRIDSDTTSYTSTLALSGAEVLRIAYEPSRIKQNA